MDIAFGEILRQKRLEQKITLRSFAKIIGKGPQFVSEMESGYSLPSGDTLQIIINELKIEKADAEMLYDMLVDLKPTKRVPDDVEHLLHSNKRLIVALRVAKDLEATDEEWSDFIKRLEESRNVKGDD